MSGPGAKASWLAAAGYVCLFASGFSDNARGPLFPGIIDTFKVTDTECSLLVVIGSLAGLPGSMLAGSHVKRRGPRSAIRLAAAVLVLGMLLVAAAGLTNIFKLIPLGAGVLGFGLGALGVCANCCVTLATPPERRAKALAALHVTYAVASLIVPLFITWAAEHAPWPHVLAGATLVPVALLPFSFAVPDAPVPDERGGRVPLRVIVPYSIALSCFVVAEVAISVWVVLYAKRATMYPGAVLLAGFFVGLGTARALGSQLLRAERVRPAIVAGALLSAVVVLLGLHVDAAFLPFEGLTVGILFPATVSALAGELAADLHGPAIGIVSGAYSAALAGAHALVGHVSDVHGLKTALHVSPACAIVGVLVFLLGTGRTHPEGHS